MDPCKEAGLESGMSLDANDQGKTESFSVDQFYDKLDEVPEIQIKDGNVGKQKVSDILQLVLWILTTEASSPNWIFVRNKPLFKKIVVAFVSGMNMPLYLQNVSHFRRIGALGGPVALNGPKSRTRVFSPMNALLNVTVKNQKKNKKFKKNKSKKREVPVSDPSEPEAKRLKLDKIVEETNEAQTPKNKTGVEESFSRSDCLLSVQEMYHNDYPLHQSWMNMEMPGPQDDEPFVPVYTSKPRYESSSGAGNDTFLTLHSTHTESKSDCIDDAVMVDGDEIAISSKTEILAPQFDPMYGVDCEMVLTEAGHELARCTVVNEQLNVIYDEYVKPARPIKDYLTKFSGISPSHLENVTKSVGDCRCDIMSLLPSNSILVGHSLENDLTALRLCHRRVIDTAMLFPHPKGRDCKNSLRFLTSHYLHRSIQKDSHDSAEDAQAALELVKLKIQKGKSFGLSKTSTESLFQVLSEASVKTAMVARPSECQKHSQHNVGDIYSCANDAEVCSQGLKAIKTSQFTFLHFSDLTHYFDSVDESESDPTDGEDLINIFEQTDAYLDKIANQMMNGSLLCVVFGQSNLDKLKALQQRKDLSQKLTGTLAVNPMPWSEVDEANLEMAVNDASSCVGFFSLKNTVKPKIGQVDEDAIIQDNSAVLDEK